MDLEQFVKSANIKPENMIKLILAGTVGLVCVWGTMRYPQVRETIFSPRSLMVFGIVLLSFLGASSLTTMTSIPSSMINLIHIWFVILGIIAIGFRAYSFAVVIGSCAYILYGLYLYHFVPDRGVFLEPVSMTETFPRLGGVGHPNSVARIAILGTLLCFYLYRVKELKWIWFVGLVLVFAYAAYLAKSRTSTAAGLIALAMLYSDSWRNRQTISYLVAGCMLIGIGLFCASLVTDSQQLSDAIVAKLSKSGTTEELASGTGRTEIWAEALDVCMKRPLFGYGFNSASYLLEIMSPHNVELSCFISGGIFAAMMMVVLHCLLIWDGFTSSNLAIRALCMYYAINLIVEDTIFETVPSQATMLCVACFVYPAAVVSYRWTVTNSLVTKDEMGRRSAGNNGKRRRTERPRNRPASTPRLV